MAKALPRIGLHVFGASGSGTTTIAGAVAERLDLLHLDADNYYWVPTDPPFQEKTDPAGRAPRILDDVRHHRRWILSGSLCSWGQKLEPHFDMAFLVTLDTPTRLARLKNREYERYGERIRPGGDMHDEHVAFLEWAAQYDTGCAPIRSLDMHTRWMAGLACPGVMVSNDGNIEDLLDEVCGHIRRLDSRLSSP